jgi:Probable cobalt transporter subunit (CbtB)
MNPAHSVVSRYPVAAALLLGLLGLYALAIDQGFILSLFQGDVAFDINLLHEVVHDVRHVAGFPCH